MNRRGFLLVLAAVLAWPGPAPAYESDVHFGLTRWLAQRAGFDAPQAEAIALGNQRVDAGLMDTMSLAPEYACAGRFAEIARQVQARHFPASSALPAKAADRAVVPGGAAARAALAALQSRLEGKAGLMLGKLGEALHPLQDSWAHAGVPDAPASIGSLACDPGLLSLHPAARGGAFSHAADLTTTSVDDLLAMARATYEVLVGYPPIDGRKRTAADWATLVAPLTAFAKADTKTAKRAWFKAAGIEDTAFLEGTSLPDGADPGPLQWGGRKLPALTVNVSNQHDAAPALRAFFDQVFSRWLGSGPVDALVAEHGPGVKDAGEELAARLKLWRLRDHGTAAALAHAKAPLTAAQRQRVVQMTKDPKASIQPASVAEAVLPLQALAPYATPLLPYVTSSLPAGAGGAPRAAAITRLRHAPYDAIALVAEQRQGRWVLVELVSVVDH